MNNLLSVGSVCDAVNLKRYTWPADHRRCHDHRRFFGRLSEINQIWAINSNQLGCGEKFLAFVDGTASVDANDQTSFA